MWSDSTIAPTANLVIWGQYGTFNGSRNFVADEGKSSVCRVIIETEIIPLYVYAEFQIIYS